MQAVDAHIGRHRQAVGLGLGQQGHAGRAADAADMHTRARGTHQLEQRVQRNGLGRHRHTAQAQTGRQRTAGGHASAQPAVLRTQPDGVAEAGGILQGAQQDLGVGQRHLRLAEADTAGLRQFNHFRQRFPLQGPRQRAQRKHARLVQLLRTELEHLDQAGLVEHRIGVGRADQAGDAAGDGRRQFAFEHAFMLITRFAQARRQVHQARRHDAAGGINGPVRREVGQRTFERDDAPGGNRHIAHFVEAGSRVNDAAVFNEDLHASFPATMLITAMRTAMPKVTCGRITL